MSRLSRLSSIIAGPVAKRIQLRGDTIRQTIGSDEAALFDSRSNGATTTRRPDYCVALEIFDSPSGDT